MLSVEQLNEILATICKEMGSLLDVAAIDLITQGIRYIDMTGVAAQNDAMLHMQGLETNARKFAVDCNAFQVTIATVDQFSQLRILKNPDGAFTYSFVKDLLNRPLSPHAVPEVRAVANHLNDSGKPVIAFFGGVRKARAKEIIQLSNLALQSLIHHYGHVAILTAGYRGTYDKVYGITRAGHDSTKFHPEQALSLVITPEVGKEDCHQHPDAISYYGETWGDDTPALISVANALIVFSPYGLVTELEIATAQQNHKPVVIINTDQVQQAMQITQAQSGYNYAEPINSFKEARDAVDCLAGLLSKEVFRHDKPLSDEAKKDFNQRLRRSNSVEGYDFHEGVWGPTAGGEQNENKGSTDKTFVNQFKSSGLLKTPPDKSQTLKRSQPAESAKGAPLTPKKKQDIK